MKEEPLDSYFKTKDESFFESGTPPRKRRQVTIEGAQNGHTIRGELTTDGEYLFVFSPMCAVAKFKECPYCVERHTKKETVCDNMCSSWSGISSFWAVQCYCAAVEDHLVSHYFQEEFALRKLEEL